MVASLFVNREVYLVLANYNKKPVEIKTTDGYISVLAPTNQANYIWRIEGRAMQILKLSKQAAEV